MLYPLKFKSIYKEKIWGGNKLATVLNKDTDPLLSIGESWELSAIEDNLSIVTNGYLEENDIQDLIEVYMGDLVGDKVYDKFGIEFPLLFKLIDAKDRLSIQVHPNDAIAREKHKAYGKTELWYVINTDKESKLTIGFNKDTDKGEFIQKVQNEDIESILNIENTVANDAFLIPAGTIHSIGAGVLLAEIQQTSDVSYRVFDYNRKDTDGNLRELHNDLAKDALNFSHERKHRIDFSKTLNKPTLITKCDYFTSNIIEFDKELERDYFNIDSFIVYMCLEGEFYIDYQEQEKVKVSKGETILIPACFDTIVLFPTSKSKVIETYID